MVRMAAWTSLSQNWLLWEGAEKRGDSALWHCPPFPSLDDVLKRPLERWIPKEPHHSEAL